MDTEAKRNFPEVIALPAQVISFMVLRTGEAIIENFKVLTAYAITNEPDCYGNASAANKDNVLGITRFTSIVVALTIIIGFGAYVLAIKRTAF